MFRVVLKFNGIAWLYVDFAVSKSLSALFTQAMILAHQNPATLSPVYWEYENVQSPLKWDSPK
jgi:hypothetical protein